MAKRKRKTEEATVSNQAEQAKLPQPEIVAVGDKKKDGKPTQEEVNAGVMAMEEMSTNLAHKAVFLHGKAKAGFAILELAWTIKRSGGTFDAAMMAVSRLHDDWMDQAVEAVSGYQEIVGEDLDLPCNECGGPTCTVHVEEECDGDHE